jgi:hypothetical protein
LRRFALHVSLVLGSVSACEHGDDGDFDFTQSDPSATATVTATSPTSGSETTGSGATTETSSPGSTGPDPSTTDTGDGDSSTTEVLPTEPCTAVDILIVIDNSDTMADEQARLGAALPAFIELVNQQLPGVLGSIHVGVITTDAPEFVTASPAMTCLPYASAANWMAYGPTLGVELGCASAVGTMGDPDERPMQMAIDSLSSELLGLDGFNEGFLREQGPLVVLIVTDEEDDLEAVTEWGSVGDPADWVDALAATQGGYVQNVIPLALVGIPEPNACANPWNGIDGAEIATRIAEFVTSFPHHAVGDLCAVEYTTFLNGAVPEISAACNAWVPE